jgi:quercetin dioxygenase-like cupin family protein
MADDVRPVSTFKPSVSHLDLDSFGAGSRAFFDFRDLGIGDATGGAFGIQVVRAKEGDPVPTGWHYHTCDVQIVYCVKGWEEIALEDGTTVRLVPGTCLNIPPGYGHAETDYSPDMEMLVFTSPAVMKTTAIDPPV